MISLSKLDIGYGEFDCEDGTIYKKITEAPSDIQDAFLQFDNFRNKWNKHYALFDPKNMSSQVCKAAMCALNKIEYDLHKTGDTLQERVDSYRKVLPNTSSFLTLAYSIYDFVVKTKLKCMTDKNNSFNSVDEILFQSWNIECCPKSAKMIQHSIENRPVLQNLPNDLIINIASYLHPREVATSMVAVNRAWTRSCYSEKMIKFFHQNFCKSIQSLNIYGLDRDCKLPFSLKQINENLEKFRATLISNLSIFNKESSIPLFLTKDIEMVMQVNDDFEKSHFQTILNLIKQNRLEEAIGLIDKNKSKIKLDFRRTNDDNLFNFLLKKQAECISKFLKNQNPERALELTLRLKPSKYSNQDNFDRERISALLILEIAEYYFFFSDNLEKGVEILYCHLDEPMRSRSFNYYKILNKILQGPYLMSEFGEESEEDLIDKCRRGVLGLGRFDPFSHIFYGFKDKLDDNNSVNSAFEFSNDSEREEKEPELNIEKQSDITPGRKALQWC